VIDFNYQQLARIIRHGFTKSNGKLAKLLPHTPRKPQ